MKRLWVHGDWLVPLCTAAATGWALWVRAHVHGPLPVSWGIDGVPDAYVAQGLWPLLLGPLSGLLAYALLRWLDVYIVGPGVNGVLTNIGLGLGLWQILLGAGNAWSLLPPVHRAPGLLVLGLFVGYLGVIALRARPIPWGEGVQELLPTPERRASAQRRLGYALMVLGLTVAAVWFWAAAPWWLPVGLLCVGVAVAVGLALAS